MNTNKKSLIVYELNEVPKKVLDYYILKRPQSNLAFLIRNGLFKQTYTNDLGELHPWSTWPTVHRGVTNKLHSIKFLNQDKECAKKYPPIWEILEKSGISIGIFGSLQTYPPYKNKNVAFFLPDTFSPQATAVPHNLELFQKFNLHLSRGNKAISGNIRLVDFFNLFLIIKEGLVSVRTIVNVSIHIIKELFDPRYKKRRSNIQALFAFDDDKIFIKFSKTKFFNKLNSEIRIFGCRCLDLANLSSGKIDCYVSEEEFDLNPDPGMLFIKESGGIIYKRKISENISFYSNHYISDILENKL